MLILVDISLMNTRQQKCIMYFYTLFLLIMMQEFFHHD